MKLTKVSCWAATAFSLFVMANDVAAAPVPFTAFSDHYFTAPGPTQAYVDGTEPGWTIDATAGELDLVKDASPELSGGPHVMLYEPIFGDFVAKVTASAADSHSFGGFYIDTSTSFIGIGFGSGFLSASYSVPGVAPPSTFVGASGGPVTLELARSGTTFTASYSTGGAFTTLYSITAPGVGGDFNFDLPPYSPVGSTDTESLKYTGFDLTALPEPATWATLVLGLFGLGAAARNARRRIVRRPTTSH